MDNIWLLQPIKDWLPTRWYGGYLPGLPDLCVGKFPSVFGKVGTDTWKVWFVETPSENVALRDALSKPVPLRGGLLDFAAGPDATVSKVDRTKHYGDAVAALYAPAEQDAGWPWISVFRLPSVKLADALSHQFARGVYSYEVDMDEASAIDRMSRMNTSISSTESRTNVVYPDSAKHI